MERHTGIANLRGREGKAGIAAEKANYSQIPAGFTDATIFHRNGAPEK
ncbi:MAG: hypothetical protein AB9903_17965 [Vulcanimicrobiota bacterium]